MKSGSVRLLLFFLLVGIAACTAPPQEATDEIATGNQADLDALQKVASDLLMTINRDDLSAFLEGVTDDVVLMPPDLPTVTGKEVIRAWAQEDFGQRTSDEDWFEDEVVISGDWGFVRGNYAVVVQSEGGEPEERTGKQLLIFRRAEDGSWKLARAIWNRTQRPEDREEIVGRVE